MKKRNDLFQFNLKNNGRKRRKFQENHIFQPDFQQYIFKNMIMMCQCDQMATRELIQLCELLKCKFLFIFDNFFRFFGYKCLYGVPSKSVCV